MSDRERAFRVLQRIANQKLTVHDSMASEPGIEHHDFVRMLVLGVLRWQGRLDNAIASIAKRKIRRIDHRTLLILRLGTLQIWFSEVPSYAAVSESTALAGKITPRARSFVNAVLRRASETTLESFDPKDATPAALAVRSSHPEWLVSRWVRTFGIQRATAILEANQEMSFPDLLVNTRRWSRPEALREIRSRSLEATPSALLDDVIRLRSATSSLSDLIRDGRLHPMDEGSVAVTRLLPDETSTVLDLCAAPGGKSLAILQTGKRVVSCDVSPWRTASLRQTLARFSGDASKVVMTDALQPGFSGRWDAVLVDAPCSATGTIRRNPEVRWRVTEAEVRSMAEVQTRILDRAMDLSSRWVLYATCSLEREENDKVVERIMAARGDFVACDATPFTPLPLRRWLDSGVLRLTPESGADGFTVTLLERTE